MNYSPGVSHKKPRNRERPQLIAFTPDSSFNLTQSSIILCESYGQILITWQALILRMALKSRPFLTAILENRSLFCEKVSIFGNWERIPPFTVVPPSAKFLDPALYEDRIFRSGVASATFHSAEVTTSLWRRTSVFRSMNFHRNFENARECTLRKDEEKNHWSGFSCHAIASSSMQAGNSYKSAFAVQDHDIWFTT